MKKKFHRPELVPVSELREQICGCLADDLNHGLGETVDEIFEDQLEDAPGDNAGRPRAEE